jgi:hypothetical protein
MDVVQSPPASSSQLPFYGATSSFNATADVLMTSEIASFHFRHLAASICLARGFTSVEAGALAELEKETERCRCFVVLGAYFSRAHVSVNS